MRTRYRMQLVILSAILLASPVTNAAEQMTDQQIIKGATAAAPAAVAKHATVVAFDAKGNMKTLRQGTNGFTCIPDNPQSPGTDPMCLDKNGWEWAQAWMSKKDPQPGKIGFGYMLQGGSDASNDDPFAKEPAKGHKWVDTGPHVMIFGATSQMEGYPTTAENPKVPYVMWGKTPYSHLMIPVK